MQHNTYTTHDSKDRPHTTFDRRIQSARERLDGLADEGRYQLLRADGELATLRYLQDGVGETIAHVTPTGLAPVADLYDLQTHRAALGAITDQWDRRDPDQLAADLRDAGYSLDDREGHWQVWQSPEDSAECTLVATFGGGATCYPNCPADVRERLHEYGYPVEPYLTAVKLRAATGDDVTIDVAERDRVLVKREIDGKVIAHVSADDEEMRIQPCAMGSEADGLQHAAASVDIRSERIEPIADDTTLAAAE